MNEKEWIIEIINTGEKLLDLIDEDDTGKVNDLERELKLILRRLKRRLAAIERLQLAQFCGLK